MSTGPDPQVATDGGRGDGGDGDGGDGLVLTEKGRSVAENG